VFTHRFTFTDGKESDMNPVEYHLLLTIHLWCGATPNQYTVDSQLRDIWTSHIPGLPYETNGIQRFMYQLYQDPIFGPCPAAHDMTPGEFVTGGDLQTVKSVYVRLLPCGAAAGATIPAEIAAPELAKIDRKRKSKSASAVEKEQADD
jgi:hypothetical protein